MKKSELRVMIQEELRNIKEENQINEDFIEKGITNFFKKLRDKRNKKQIEKLKQNDPDLAKTFDFLAAHQADINDALAKIAAL